MDALVCPGSGLGAKPRPASTASSRIAREKGTIACDDVRDGIEPPTPGFSDLGVIPLARPPFKLLHCFDRTDAGHDPQRGGGLGGSSTHVSRARARLPTSHPSPGAHAVDRARVRSRCRPAEGRRWQALSSHLARARPVDRSLTILDEGRIDADGPLVQFPPIMERSRKRCSVLLLGLIAALCTGAPTATRRHPGADRKHRFRTRRLDWPNREVAGRSPRGLDRPHHRR